MNKPDSTHAIRGRNLSKIYQLYDSPIDRLKESLHPFRKKYHHQFTALQNLNFEIFVGEMIGVIGENGSGKSTLLKIIAGILAPSSGAIQVNGRVSAILELGAGFNPEMTGLENIYLTGAIMGYSRSQLYEKIAEIKNFSEIGEFLNQPVKTYSSGMYVRLAFSIATNVDPEILLVDEALSVGDMYFQAKSMQKMKHLMSQNCTTLFVSHDTNAVKSLCDRCIYLQDGNIKLIGPSGEVIDQYVEDQIERTGKRVIQAKTNEIPKTTTSHVKKFGFTSLSEFHRNASLSRSGSQRMRVVYASIFDLNDQEIKITTFGETIRLKIFWESVSAFQNLVVAFYLRDKNRVEVIGSNNSSEGVQITEIEPENTYCTEFEFVNYLRAGNYSIQLVLADQLACSEYYDWIENAIFFQSQDQIGSRKWALYNPPLKCCHSLFGASNE